MTVPRITASQFDANVPNGNHPNKFSFDNFHLINAPKGHSIKDRLID